MANHSTTVGGSAAAHFIQCPGHYSLVKDLPRDDGPNDAADRGSMLHTVMEKILLEDKTPQDMLGFEDPNFPGHICTQDEIDEAVIPALDALNRIVKEFGEFDYECEAKVKYPHIDNSFGTSDIVGANDDYFFIIDWKFGRGYVPAKGNRQLRFYAYSAIQTPNVADMFKQGKKIVLAIIQPKNEDALEYEVIERSDLLSFAEELNAAWENAKSDAPTFAEGSSCQFCRGKINCPIKRKGVDLGLTKVNEPINIPELPDLLPLCDQLESFIKAVRKEAHQALERGESIHGYKLVPKRATRKWSDEAQALKSMTARRIKKEELVKETLLSPAQAEKVFKKRGLDFSTMSDLISATSSGNTMAPDSDKRPDAIATAGQGVDLGLPTK